MHSFIADCFACFDRLDPIEAHVREDWSLKIGPKAARSSPVVLPA